MNKPKSISPKTMQAAKETAQAAVQEAGIKMEDVLAMVVEHGQPIKDAVEDLPAQVYNLSRVTLAARFIYEVQVDHGNTQHGFNQVGFEQCWGYLTGETAENAG